MRNNKAITLIALIITIIVMLILVAVTVKTAVNSGLFGYAKNATGEWSRAQEEEKNLGNGKIIDDIMNEIEIPNATEKIGTRYEVIHEYFINGVLTGSMESSAFGFSGDVIDCKSLSHNIYMNREFNYSPNNTEFFVLKDKPEENVIVLKYER
jgi:hypothetical protein